MDSRPPIAEALLSLAPLHLPNFRSVRYAGDDVCVSMDRLVARDQALVRQLYQELTEILYVIADEATDDAQKWAGVERWLARHDLDLMIDGVRELGTASYALHGDEKLARAVHDIRGGAMSALIGRLALQAEAEKDENHLKVLFVLVRDHLKIMRSAMVGLDEPRRNADRQERIHAVGLMIEKWQESVVGPKSRDRPVRMVVDCRYEGGLTQCCLESAAVDRIFYNLANNAARHVAGDRLDMAIFPIPDPSSDCLRFVLSNPVGAEDAAFLHSMRASSPDGNLLRLFDPQVSSTGSGFGLTVVTEFVAGAFGLGSRSEALRRQYVGAVLDEDTFRIWFHWPATREQLSEKLDDFRQPAKSLSEG